MITERTRSRVKILIAVCALCFFAGENSVSAFSIQKLNVESQNDFVLEPGKVEVYLNPGETYTKAIIVTNRTPRKVTFKIGIEDFVGTDNAESPIMLLGDDRSPYSFKDNIVPETSEFTLDFGEQATIPVTITVPENAQPGGYYSSVLVSNELDKAAEASTTNTITNTRIVSRVGVLYFVRVKGDVNENGHVADFRISPQQFFYEKGPFNFQTLFINEGNVHLVPYGLITVKNLWGKGLAELPINGYFALPESIRYREVVWDKPLLIGRYTATLELHRGYGDMVDTKTISFWVLPWKILTVSLLAILAILSLFYYIFTRFEFRKKK